MSLSLKEKELLIKNQKTLRTWSPHETDKIKEIKYKLHITPRVIFISGVFKNKTYNQIRDKFYSV